MIELAFLLSVMICGFVQLFNHFYLLQTEKALELLGKFERIEGAKLNIAEKYNKLMANYGRDLEAVRKLYQKLKNEPPTARNLPPVAGRIAWARQMYRRIDAPMKVFKRHPEILKVIEFPGFYLNYSQEVSQTNEAKKTIKNFNKMASVLMEYEMLYHRGWIRAVDSVKTGMHAALLVKHPDTKELFVNFDPAILELIQEAKCLAVSCLVGL